MVNVKSQVREGEMGTSDGCEGCKKCLLTETT